MKKKPKHSMEKAFWLKNLFLIACLLCKCSVNSPYK